MRFAQKFKDELLELKKQVEDGVTEFTEAAQRRIDKYLVFSTAGRGGVRHVSFNDAAIQERMDSYGYFALGSNQAMPTFKRLEY